jgi:hypothetical protein
MLLQTVLPVVRRFRLCDRNLAFRPSEQQQYESGRDVRNTPTDAISETIDESPELPDEPFVNCDYPFPD